MSFVIIKKSQTGYTLQDGTGGPYSLQLLSEKYPDHKFIVSNEDYSFAYPNVYSKSDLLAACELDNKLKCKCPECSSKYEYTKSVCPKCKKENFSADILKEVLGTDYTKAFWGMRMQKAMEPVYDFNKSETPIDDKTKELVGMIHSGFKLSFNCHYVPYIR